jgi:hypothetical protein
MRALMIALTGFWLTAPAATAKEAASDQPTAQDMPVPKPVSTTKIKPCPDGYELVTRHNGQHACAKDLMPANE